VHGFAIVGPPKMSAAIVAVLLCWCVDLLMGKCWCADTSRCVGV
jgi:hypothetical protein